MTKLIALLPLAALPMLLLAQDRETEECVCQDVCPCHRSVQSPVEEDYRLPPSAWGALRGVLERVEGLHAAGYSCNPILLKSDSIARRGRGERVRVAMELDFPAKDSITASLAHLELQKAFLNWDALEDLEGYSSEPLEGGRGLHISGTRLDLDYSQEQARPVHEWQPLELERLMHTIRALSEQPEVEIGPLRTRLKQREVAGGVEHRLRVVPHDAQDGFTWLQVTRFPQMLEDCHAGLVISSVALKPVDAARSRWTFELELTLRAGRD